MTSAKQLAANRRNSAESTGPRTEEGKARSRMNALRHGLAAKSPQGALWESILCRSIEEIHARYRHIDAQQRELLILIEREMKGGSTEKVVAALQRLRRLSRYTERASRRLKADR